MSAILEIFLVIVLAEIIGNLIISKPHQHGPLPTKPDSPHKPLPHRLDYKPPRYDPWANDDGPDVDHDGYLLPTSAAMPQYEQKQ